MKAARIPVTAIPTLSTKLDARELALYSLAELSMFLKVPKATLHAWSRSTKLNGKLVEPLVTPAEQVGPLYSFYNLAEAHILSMTTRFHGVKTVNVRRAMQLLCEGSLHDLPHPLLSDQFLTDGRHLWLKQLERRIDLSQYGQLGLAPVLDTYLERIERDDSFMPKKLFPMKQDGRFVSITPSVSSGRPIVEGTGIPVDSIWNRNQAGDSAAYLGDDYDLSIDEVNGAIGYFEETSAIQ